MHCFVFANSFTMLFLIQNLCVAMVLMANQGLSHLNEQEPQGNCRFDYEYKVLQKLLDSEHANKEQNQRIEEQNQRIEDLVKKNLDLETKIETIITESKETVATLQSSLDVSNHAIGHLTSQVKNLSRSSSDGDQRPFYGFSAYESSSPSQSKGSAIIFKHTRLNEGGVYNTGTGAFTVPVDGIYVFHATLCIYLNRAIYVAFMADEEVLGMFASNDKDYSSCHSGSAFARLQKGSQVILKVTAVSSGSVLYDDNHRMNSFSGFLVAM